MNIEQYRQETDGCKSVIHLNNSGASLTPNVVRDQVMHYYQQEALNGGYETQEEHEELFAKMYEDLASLIGAVPGEIAIVSSATAAWSLAFQSLELGKGDVMLVSEVEYVSNYLNMLNHVRRYGSVIKVIPSDEYGRVDVEKLKGMLSDKVKLVAVTHVPTNSGLINPIEEIGEVLEGRDIPFLVDACQSVGQMPLDVKKIKCTFLSTTGRKFLRGPRGTGFLFVAQDFVASCHPPRLDLSSAEWQSATDFELRAGAKRFELFEASFAARVGLAVAARYALDVGLDQIWTRIQSLSAYARDRFEQIPEITLYDRGPNNCGIISFGLDGWEPSDLVLEMRKRGVNISSSDRSSTLLDMDLRGLESVSRIGIHYYNTQEEIDQFIGQLVDLITG